VCHQEKAFQYINENSLGYEQGNGTAMLQSSARSVNPIREGAVNMHFNYFMKKGGLLASDE
jgi:hypothetical protein